MQSQTFTNIIKLRSKDKIRRVWASHWSAYLVGKTVVLVKMLEIKKSLDAFVFNVQLEYTVSSVTDRIQKTDCILTNLMYLLLKHIFALLPLLI